jgi:hypothetical protein
MEEHDRPERMHDRARSKIAGAQDSNAVDGRIEERDATPSIDEHWEALAIFENHQGNAIISGHFFTYLIGYHLLVHVMFQRLGLVNKKIAATRRRYGDLFTKGAGVF